MIKSLKYFFSLICMCLFLLTQSPIVGNGYWALGKALRISDGGLLAEASWEAVALFWSAAARLANPIAGVIVGA
ncbi:hypothetical protein [Treponema denticola]|uniref:hypothetical protein n=1 Tax=Treponema denticola TaxID=158 RepID=UPI0001FD3B90|nr:hypothetical protein [Treponema denticola]EGC77893.1 hypothetical protein HMPREF9353_00740 [Treponema denticola F0402]